VAGFAFAAKYTAFLALPYALGVVAWKNLRTRKPVLKPLAIVAGCAALMIAPWLIKNAVWLGNPLAPFANRVFPNPYFHISFEIEYARQMQHYNGMQNYAGIPLEITVHGGTLGGVLGLSFLLAPLALLALRSPAGGSLLLAALVFAIPYAANIGTRFLIPALPFVALSLGLAAASWRPAAILVVVLTRSFPGHRLQRAIPPATPRSFLTRYPCGRRCASNLKRLTCTRTSTTTRWPA